jgi:hypothetical protein
MTIAQVLNNVQQAFVGWSERWQFHFGFGGRGYRRRWWYTCRCGYGLRRRNGSSLPVEGIDVQVLVELKILAKRVRVHR